jgi:serine/threonine-protein kinase
MEYLDGSDLLSYLEQDEPLQQVPPTAAPYGPRLIPAFYQLASGVHALHRADMLHRDLKPSNVVVANHRVVVLDFGLVRDLNAGAATLTEEGSIAGTPAYMAPEQARGQELSAASDWYAFGVMLYEALTGRMPYSASSVSELAIKVATSDPVPIRRLRPEVPWSLARIVGRACARDREQRYANARALRTELARFANQREFRRVITIGAAPVQLAAASEGADLAQPEPGLAARPANYEPTQPTHVAAFPRTVFASETAARVRPRQLLASRRRIAIVIALGLAILTAAIMTRRRASSAALAPVLPAVIERWSPPAASASAPPVAEAHPPTVAETLNPSGSSSMAPVAEVPSTAPADGELRSSRRPETKLAHKPRAASVSPPASPHPDPLKVLGF